MPIKKEDISNINNFRLTKVIIHERFDAWTYTKGDRYFRNGAVMSCEAKKNEINGQVEGNYSPFYRTKLTVKNGRLIGNCSCPVGVNCKHCVALALQWIEDKNNQDREDSTKNLKQLKLSEKEDILEEDSEYPNEANKSSEIPLELMKTPIGNVKSYIQSLPRPDLENLVSFFMKEFTKTQKITIFTPKFITLIWNSRLTQLDDDFEEFENQSSPLTILELIEDDTAKKKCIETWFKGYIDLLSHIKFECELRGMLDEDGEELYEYYKNEEYNRLEEEFLEESNERYENSYNKWGYNDYDYLEPYDHFDLDTSTLKSYIEDFFRWLFAPMQDICNYSLYLHQYHLKNHQDYLIKNIQWLKDLRLPTEEYGINSENFSALLDLKSMIATKTSLLTNFSSKIDQINYLYSIFIQNPSQRNSEAIWTQFHHISPTEQHVQYFIEKILKNFENKPTWEKFILIKRLILEHQPEFINSLLEVSIDCLSKAPDAEYIIKEIFSILEELPVDTTLAIESDLKQASLKIPTQSHRENASLYRKTIDWLVNFYIQKKMLDRAFNSLIELANVRPKTFEFRDYKTLKRILPYIKDQFTSEFDKTISLIIQKGRKDVGFRLLLDQEKYDQACERIESLSNFSYSYSPYSSSQNHDTQWGAIMRLIPHISSISDRNKENMIKMLKAQISGWVSHSSRNRPDASIAEAISQIRTIYLAFKNKDGEKLWKNWFKSFSNKHWRLRNLRSALNKKGIEMKKS